MLPSTHLALAHTIVSDRVRAADNARRARDLRVGRGWRIAFRASAASTPVVIREPR